MVSEINQSERDALLRQIARGDRTAVRGLSDLYARNGYPTMARVIARAETDDRAWRELRKGLPGRI
jgi:hypothetical protein